MLLLPKVMNHLLQNNFSHEGLRKGQWGTWPGKIWSEIRTATFLRSHYIHLNTVAKHEPPKEKEKKEKKKTKIQQNNKVVTLVLRSTGTYDLQGRCLGVVFLQRWIKKIVINRCMFSSVIITRRVVWKRWKERLQACVLLILLAHHPHRKSCTSQNRPTDQSKSSQILCLI